MAQPIGKAEYEKLASFRYALRQFMHFSEAAAREAGITPRQHQALLAIAGLPGRDEAMMSELAERLQLRHHSTVELIDRLVAHGLVARESGVEDRRQVYVSLTPEGHEMLARLSVAHREELKRIGPQLNLLLAELTTIDDPEADQL
ncbi:MAG: MarR family transcriptional regulator [Anaerolineae bacterium]|nr:MarR family transcriptional regulator [Anaerolineae bacterium]RIK14704.1 MAG: MarR family transcriptional regulator [Anaerolineae bacterium]